jgi:hypothetical protein
MVKPLSVTKSGTRYVPVSRITLPTAQIGKVVKYRFNFLNRVAVQSANYV